MKKSDAIQLNIPNPCRQDWNKMHPVDGGRFCDSCQHAVIDFTGYTDAQLYSFFSAYQGQRVCGRYYANQLDRVIAIPPQPHSRLYRLAVAAGLTILALVPVYDAQARFRVPFVVEGRVELEEEPTDDVKTITLRGMLVSEQGYPLARAIVYVIKNGAEKEILVTDPKGQFVSSPLTYASWTQLELRLYAPRHYQEQIAIDINHIPEFYDVIMRIDQERIKYLQNLESKTIYTGEVSVHTPDTINSKTLHLRQP